MGERDHDRDQHDGPRANHRLTVAQAADRLGIKEGAVRSRIKRGTLPTVKEGDRVYVVFGGGPSEANHAADTEGPTGEPSDPRELVEEMRDHIADLREQLNEEREARRRADTIIMQLTQANAALSARVPEIEAAPAHTPRGSRESSAAEGEPDTNTPPDQASPQTAAQPRLWWRRLIGS